MRGSFPMLFILGAVLPAGAAGQSSGPAVTVEYYYKLVPGATKEWRELYTKNHHPILKQLLKEGLLVSERLFERRFHALEPAWDYKVVLVWRDWAAMAEAGKREPEATQSLFPERAAHERQEKRRWEITLDHWDDVLTELPLE